MKRFSKLLLDYFFPKKFEIRISGDVFNYKVYQSLYRFKPKWVSLDKFFETHRYSHNANVNSLIREVIEYNNWIKVAGNTPESFYYKNVMDAEFYNRYIKFLEDGLLDESITESQRKRNSELLAKHKSPFNK